MFLQISFKQGLFGVLWAPLLGPLWSFSGTSLGPLWGSLWSLSGASGELSGALPGKLFYRLSLNNLQYL